MAVNKPYGIVGSRKRPRHSLNLAWLPDTHVMRADAAIHIEVSNRLGSTHAAIFRCDPGHHSIGQRDRVELAELGGGGSANPVSVPTEVDICVGRELPKIRGLPIAHFELRGGRAKP